MPIKTQSGDECSLLGTGEGACDRFIDRRR